MAREIEDTTREQARVRPRGPSHGPRSLHSGGGMQSSVHLTLAVFVQHSKQGVHKHYPFSPGHDEQVAHLSTETKAW